jgi:hypothetical protein
MTIVIPEPNTADKILKFLGKKRGIIFPDKAVEIYGQHVHARAHKESFWRALLRPGNQELPEDMVDVFSYQNLKDEAQLRS